MTTSTPQVAAMPLLDKLRATHLPPPERRRAIRESAKLSREDIARELSAQGLHVTATAVYWWELSKSNGGCDPRSQRAFAYRQLLRNIERQVATWDQQAGDAA